MKIIVGGAGNVGKSIVGYLSRGNNDIVVIDDNEKHLNDLAREWDVLPILGSVSHPDILQKADAGNADLLIAATDSDEVNMIACQAAYSLFNVPRKIARIASRIYFKPDWGGLFSDDDIPIDLIVSPEFEIARSIVNVLKIPGMSAVYPLADDKINLLSFRCPKKCPLIQMPFSHLERVAPDMRVAIISIFRNGKVILPHGDDILHIGDEVSLLVETDKIESVIHNFGLERKANENILLFGGNHIVRYLAEFLEKDDSINSVKIIDENPKTAALLAQHLNNTVVFSGPMMSDAILTEAGLANADAVVAVTLEDRDNIIASMLAKRNGVENSIALVNYRNYNTQIVNVNDNIIIDRTSITISSILQELRKVKLSNAYSLGAGFGEVWEIVIDDNSSLVGSTIDELKLPKNSKIFIIIRQTGEIIFASSKDKIKLNDKLIFFSEATAIKKSEQIFW